MGAQKGRVVRIEDENAHQQDGTLTAACRDSADVRGPRFLRPDGSPLPRRLRALRASFEYAPPLASRVLRRLLERRLVLTLPEMLVEMPDGRRLHVQPGDRTYRRVFVLGEHEPETSAALRRFSASGSFAVDVGAHQGWLALLLAKEVGPDGTVWAFEPTPAVLPALYDNLARNPELRVDVFEHALGAERGEVVINVFAGLPSAHASASTFGRDDFTSYAVPVRPLDALRAQMPKPPGLVKIDVEGAELSVLRGARETLAGAERAVVVLEVNYQTSAAFGYRPIDLLTELRRHRSYGVFRATMGGLIPETAPEEAPHGATWVCVPPALAADM
jgi:FkbM family methyltransferase